MCVLGGVGGRLLFLSFIGGTRVQQETVARETLSGISDHLSSPSRKDNEQYLVKYTVRKSMAVMTSLL